MPGSFLGLGPFEILSLEAGNIPPEVREEANRGNYKVVLKDNSYLCPGCKRKIKELKELKDYEDDLPKFVKDFLS